MANVKYNNKGGPALPFHAVVNNSGRQPVIPHNGTTGLNANNEPRTTNLAHVVNPLQRKR